MKMRMRRNPRRDYTDDQKADRRRADIMAVRARIYELGVSKMLEDDYGLDTDATQACAAILAEAAITRHDSEEIYNRIRRETDAAEEPQAEAPTDHQPFVHR